MKRVVFALLLTLCFIVSLGDSSRSHAELDISWITSPLKVTYRGDIDKLPKLDYFGLPCTDIGTYDYMYYGYSKPERMTQKASQGTCLNITDYGKWSTDSLMLTGTDVAIGFYDDNNLHVRDFLEPIPDSDDILHFNGQTKGMFVYPDVLSNITPTYKNSYLIFANLSYYKMAKPLYSASDRINYDDNSPVLDYPTSDSFSFNKSGDYLSFTNRQFPFLVDLNTRVAFRYGINGLNPYNSSIPRIRTTLTPDANTSFVTTHKDGLHNTVYDLYACKAASGKVRNCPSRDITGQLRGSIPEYSYTIQANFVTNDQLDVYVNTSSGKKLYSVTLADAQPSSFQYLALGDSFASGEGARNYKPNTDFVDNRCHVSKVSYPYLISTDLSLPQTESVACSGAKMKDIYFGDEDEYNRDEKQSQGKYEPIYDNEIYTNFLTGYRSQDRFINKHKPTISTLSIGGNDIGFGDIIKSCVAPGSCYKSDGDRQGLLSRIQSQFDNLVNTYTRLKDASPNTKLYIVGYPSIVDPSDDAKCALNVRLSKQDRQLAQKIVEDLNAIIEKATKKTGVGYVDVKNALVGHRLCETDSWNVAVNGLTAGNDTLGLIGNESYHPNQLGHILLAGAIERQTDKFQSIIMPKDDNITKDLEISHLVPNQKNSNNLSKATLNEFVSPYVLEPGDKISTSIQTNEIFNYPGAEYTVEIHSDPQVIGQAVAEGMNKVKINAKLPSDISLGYHTIHVYGHDIAGNPVDIYRPVVVVYSLNDFDGDGVPNDTDGCSFVEPSGIDIDGDNTDDTCDSFIDRPAKHSPLSNIDFIKAGDAPSISVPHSNRATSTITSHMVHTGLQNESTPKDSITSTSNPEDHKQVLGSTDPKRFGARNTTSRVWLYLAVTGLAVVVTGVVYRNSRDSRW